MCVRGQVLLLVLLLPLVEHRARQQRQQSCPTNQLHARARASPPPPSPPPQRMHPTPVLQLTDQHIADLPIPRLQSNGFLFVWVINAKYQFCLDLFDKWGYE